jgi:hypothetical protein
MTGSGGASSNHKLHSRIEPQGLLDHPPSRMMTLIDALEFSPAQ